MRLSTAIRRGARKIGEVRDDFIRRHDFGRGWCGCALTTAAVGAGFRPSTIDNNVWRGFAAGDSNPVHYFAKLLKIPTRQARLVSRRHYCGVPRLVIAADLAKRGL